MSDASTQRRLGEILVESGHVAAGQVADALAAGSGPLGQRLLARGWITPRQLAQALAEQFGLPHVTLPETPPAEALFALLPAERARELGVVPLRRENGTLEIATADPRDPLLVESLERLTGLRVRLAVTDEPALQAALRHGQGGDQALQDATADFRLEMVHEGEAGEEHTVVLDPGEAATNPVIRLVNSLLVAALQRRASDVHIETYERGLSVKFRIDGVLYPVTDVLDRRHHSAVVTRLKVMAELDIAERRIPQDGRFKLRVDGRRVDFRISVLPSVFGEDVVLRILDKTSLAMGAQRLSLDDLGIAPEVLVPFRRHIRAPYGMVLITGPTGSGKTTTLYAALNELNTREEKIVTIEDPVEYQLDGVVQVPVNEKKQLTFARGLRSILRHDPDKIMVGEIRDGETVQIAVQSALTGHLVFTTVHANNAFDVVGRFGHMGVDVHSFVSALNCVMAQRLVRTLCPRCKRPSASDAALAESSGLAPEQVRQGQWHEAVGCGECGHTGYRGRTAVTEFLHLSPRIRELMLARRPPAELLAAAQEEGMVPLRTCALRKAMAGETTLTEINRVTFAE